MTTARQSRTAPKALALLLPLALSAPVMAQSGDAPDRSGQRVWDCVAGATTFTVSAGPGTPDAQVAVRANADMDAGLARSFTLGRVAPFPRFDFSDGTARFYRAGESVLFSNDAIEPTPCDLRLDTPIMATGETDFAGRSLGGRLRAGPGVQYAPLGSLSTGTPLTVMRNTEESYEDFDWFEVVVEGTTLYHWGGILCGVQVNLQGSAGPCTQALPSDAQTLARSRGGNLRAGPGTEFDEVGTLSAGTQVRIIGNTGIALNDYSWFEIATDTGTAYHWGGLICTQGEPLAGTEGPCE